MGAKIDLLKIVESMINLDPKMRFAAIIDAKGNIREAIMKSGKTSLKTQKEKSIFVNKLLREEK